MSEPTKELIQQLTERWKGGERLPSLARDASTAVGKELACATVRNWIVKEVGGKEKFAVASAARDEAHPRIGGFGGGGGVVIDDSEVPTLKGAPLKEGWQLTHIVSHGRREDVIVSPDGKRYVHALAQERADLIYSKPKTRGLPPLRLRLEHTSHVAKKVRQETKLVKQGEDQRERESATKPKQVRRKK
jgi:hypothetical protein